MALPIATSTPPRAIVTGASSGIGRAIAVALARSGLRLLLVGRNVSRLEEAARTCGGETDILACDLTSFSGLSALQARVPTSLGILVHAAGAYRSGALSGTDGTVLDELLAINVRVPHEVTRICMPALRAARGQVIFVNSSQGLTAGREVGGYAATKHALKALADALRAEVNTDGIRVLSIYLGRTATPMQASIHAAEGREYKPHQLIQPEDVGTMVLAALSLSRATEVTDIIMRPMKPA